MRQQAKPGQPEQVPQTTLAESDEAIYNLLESLLEEVEQIPVEPQVAVETPVKPVEKVKARVKTVIKPEPVEVIAEPEPVKVSTPEPITITETVAEPGYPEYPLPDWAGSTISCLLCDVEGVEIAVPLMEIMGISAWNMRTLPMPVQPDWHLGVVEYRGDKVVIADTARIIMPEKMTRTADERRQNHPGHFILVNPQLALSCNEIRETIKLEPDQIRWRPRRPSRSWAMGTLIDRLCILLDTQALTQEIQQV